MILKCNCIHKAQDELHGKGNRVHNEMKSPSARCTVCGDKKSIGAKKAKVK